MPLFSYRGLAPSCPMQGSSQTNHQCGRQRIEDVLQGSRGEAVIRANSLGGPLKDVRQ